MALKLLSTVWKSSLKPGRWKICLNIFKFHLLAGFCSLVSDEIVRMSISHKLVDIKLLTFPIHKLYFFLYFPLSKMESES